MWLHLLRPGQHIPAGSYTNAQLGLFKIVPPPGEAWRMLHNLNNGIGIARGRFVSKPAGFTNLIVQINPHPTFGSPTGLEAGLLTLSATSITNANSWMMPYFRLLANGTAGAGDTDAVLMLGLGMPIVDVQCLAAVAGMPWQAGQSLLDPDLGFVEVH